MESIMHKLINAYRKLPSPSNRVKLQKYLDKHMMAVCLATPDDIAFLRANDFKL
jgi:predicted nucleotide-binding protein